MRRQVRAGVRSFAALGASRPRAGRTGRRCSVEPPGAVSLGRKRAQAVLCLKPPFLPSGAFTVRGATITGLESIKEGKGYWVALYQRATREIQNSLSP